MDDALISRSTEMLEAEVNGEMVALHVETGACYGFNRTAMRVWQLLEMPRSFASVREALLEEFDVERSECERDLAETLEEMSRRNLIKSSSPLKALPPAA